MKVLNKRLTRSDVYINRIIPTITLEKKKKKLKKDKTKGRQSKEIC